MNREIVYDPVADLDYEGSLNNAKRIAAAWGQDVEMRLRHAYFMVSPPEPKSPTGWIGVATEDGIPPGMNKWNGLPDA